jgi:glycosyltransferase involved in cell wall biosynthesis
MPALLDSRMLAALAATRTDYAVVVHDAQAHPGEALNFHALGQRRLLRGARCLFTLTQHVEDALRRQHFGQHGQILAKLWHPPVGVAVAPRPQRDSARPRLLYFGRLLAYKGLDLLADALAILGPDMPFEVRICGYGPDSHSLARLRALPGVTVERRWVADRDVPELLAWADALVLPYREASQSGVAAMAVAAGRHVLATRVGGLPEQLDGLAHALLCAPAAADIAHGLLELAARWRAAPEVAPLDATAGWRAMACEMASILGTLPPLDAESTSPAPRRRRAVREDSAFRKA